MAKPIATNKNMTRMMIFPVVKSITKDPKINEKIPPIAIVQGTTFVGKYWTRATNMMANTAETMKLLHRAS